MGSKKGLLPDVLFVAPVGCREKIRHRHMVFKIEECDDEGLPRKLTMLREDETVNVDTDPPARFMTAYIQARMAEPNPDCANFRSAGT